MGCAVLLVEDDEDVREAICEELVELGCEVACAEGALQALAQLRRGLQPDFILLDLLLPQMRGTELLRALKAEAAFEPIPVVLMSASVRAAGTTPVLRKPLRRSQLEQMVGWFGRASPAEGGAR